MTDEGKYQDLSLDQLQSSIRESIHRNGRFLLLLDDLWDEDCGRGSKLWSILSSDDAKGSKIIITKRHLSVAKAMRADEILDLQGLSRDKSWALLSRYAFSKDQENDPTWINIGQKIVSKCSDVPLAIKSIASLLRVKDTIGEWRSLENEQLSKIQLSDNPIMATLRLSYDPLPSHLKNCFAYCSLFPKGHQLDREHLIYLWIAHGCITPKKDETLDMAGNTCFMELFRRSFFQEMKYSCDDKVEVISCKMHDLVHDLAEDVAGEESCIITSQEKYQCHKRIRHLCVDYLCVDYDTQTQNIDNPLLLLDADRLRTALYTRFSFCPKYLDEKVTKFRFLRALSLGCQNIEYVPSSIGGLKYLRYLDLSDNKFTHMPNSITKLVNLIILDVGYCYNLVTFPRDIGELASLKYLINQGKLRCMPPSFGDLTSLEHLSNFLVTNNGELCGLIELGRLNIRGSLMISFHDAVEWSRDQVLFEPGKVPETLEALHINDYPSMKMEAWWKEINPDSRMHKLKRLLIRKSLHVKHLPPLRHLPCLRSLHLFKLCELEFIEVDEVLSTKPFFPSLCTLKIVDMENLKGWSTTPNAILVFPCLSELLIADCPLLSSLPIDAPHLKSLYLTDVKAELFDQLVSRSCARSVEKIVIDCCANLESFSGECLTSLRSLKLVYCKTLRNVKVAANTVEEFTVLRCPNIELWEQTDDHELSVDWASFGKLCVLNLDEWQQDSIGLPDCLQQLMILGKLRVEYRGY